jgi:hypothetical protein
MFRAPLGFGMDLRWISPYSYCFLSHCVCGVRREIGLSMLRSLADHFKIFGPG